MKRLLAAALVAAPCMAGAQVTCQVVGQFTYCSDGSQYQRIGNTLYIWDAPGHQRQQAGQYDFLARGIKPPNIQPQPPQLPARPPGVRAESVCGYDAYGQYGCR